MVSWADTVADTMNSKLESRQGWISIVFNDCLEADASMAGVVLRVQIWGLLSFLKVQKLCKVCVDRPDSPKRSNIRLLQLEGYTYRRDKKQKKENEEMSKRRGIKTVSRLAS